MILSLLVPWLAGLAIGQGMERLLRPRVAPPWQRHASTWIVELATWTLLFGLFTLVLQRPWFAMAFVLSLLLVVVQSSNTKWDTLREPFICHDFEYFVDAIRHPRLYVPFFGVWLALGATAAGALAIAAFLWLEPSLASRYGLLASLQAELLLVVPAGLALALAVPRLPRCSLTPADDLQRLGLYASLWAYGRLATRPWTPPDSTAFALPEEPLPTETLPHVVAVQSESFFDPRSWIDGLAPDLLEHHDALQETAMRHGRLSVPVWGANTVRTETAFLTGLEGSALGIHQFNPYHQLTRHSVPSLAAAMRDLGYRTVCVHPYPASFYGRDKVMPHLGFDAFLDIDAFSDDDRCGQYIGDLAVAEMVGVLLQDQDNKPLFVFVITMENHGPLDLDTWGATTDLARLAPNVATWPEDGSELHSYLAHLRNADRMIAGLRQTLAGTERDGMLCWYGDHVPIMPNAYRHFGAPVGDTPYTIWSSRQPRRPQDETPLRADQLGAALWQSIIATGRQAPITEGRQQNHQEQA
ncbi:LTA synthase family protein [Halomonas sp. THAF12]|uniref:LTA synthase family protein n=1 Tax=Halomonas sp. B23F22_10 TaxID=3459515 RepID=UPI00373EFECE